MLSERQNSLLNFIIREYIKTAHPVPSAIVSQQAGLRVSPATVRNEMTDLEEAGFLVQPHTSGGRVPTDKAYRYYVDTLLYQPASVISLADKKQINSVVQEAGFRAQALNKAVAEVLSELSGNLVIAGIAGKAEFSKKGLANLFHNPEFRQWDNVFQLTAFFEAFEQTFQLVEREFFQTLGRPSQIPIQVLVGEENPFQQMNRESIMCARYRLPGDIIGSLTLVGPTRMDYERNIGLIQYTTQFIKNINHI